jgi:predicted ATP-binding protein involved in virulence
MRIKQLSLKDFGPFKRYNISFLEDDDICLLLTGKNNEGKSSLLNSLKLLNAATKVINKKNKK